MTCDQSTHTIWRAETVFRCANAIDAIVRYDQHDLKRSCELVFVSCFISPTVWVLGYLFCDVFHWPTLVVSLVRSTGLLGIHGSALGPPGASRIKFIKRSTHRRRPLFWPPRRRGPLFDYPRPFVLHGKFTYNIEKHRVEIPTQRIKHVEAHKIPHDIF